MPSFLLKINSKFEISCGITSLISKYEEAKIKNWHKLIKIMEWNITSRGKIKYIVNLLVSVIALPGKDSTKKPKKCFMLVIIFH